MPDVFIEMEKKGILKEDNLTVLKTICGKVDKSLLKKIEDYELNLLGKTKQGLFPTLFILEVMYKVSYRTNNECFSGEGEMLVTEGQRSSTGAPEGNWNSFENERLDLLLFSSFWTLYTTCILPL